VLFSPFFDHLTDAASAINLAASRYKKKEPGMTGGILLIPVGAAGSNNRILGRLFTMFTAALSTLTELVARYLISVFMQQLFFASSFQHYVGLSCDPL
jgi:hypothetical protein